MSMTDFFTRENAEAGIEVPLFRPGEDSPSGQWIRIRGVDSDQFRDAEASSRRKLRELAGDPKADLTQAYRDGLIDVMSSLVISWSFDEECTPQNVKKFLREAPQIADNINQLATRRKLFFKNGSNSSENTPEPSSN